MKAKTNNLKTLAEFKDEFYGKTGTEKRDKLEKGYEQFKLGALIHEARIEKGLTQEELAHKSGTTKSYISRIENNGSNLTLKTLYDIVEKGFGGKVKIEIEL